MHPTFQMCMRENGQRRSVPQQKLFKNPLSAESARAGCIERLASDFPNVHAGKLTETQRPPTKIIQKPLECRKCTRRVYRKACIRLSKCACGKTDGDAAPPNKNYSKTP